MARRRVPSSSRLRAGFYERPTVEVLAELIGKVLVHETRGTKTSGIIVEAEAYVGEDDPACHAACGPTRRNAPLYGPPGHAYVYLNYGVHWLMNAVTEAPGFPAAILIRALEPLEGLPAMRQRRSRRRRLAPVSDADLCRGPGNLTTALAIGASRNAGSLTSGPMTIEDRRIRAGRLEWSPRIGIRVGTERLWRCTWAQHPCLSGPAGRRAADYRTPR